VGVAGSAVFTELVGIAARPVPVSPPLRHQPHEPQHLGTLPPGQQVLDVKTKLITHEIRMAASSTATAPAR
jgi:hypothetical protein